MKDKYPKCYNKYIIQNKSEYYVNKQNKRKLILRHRIRQALKPANDTRDQDLDYANNTKCTQTTINYNKKNYGCI